MFHFAADLSAPKTFGVEFALKARVPFTETASSHRDFEGFTQ